MTRLTGKEMMELLVNEDSSAREAAEVMEHTVNLMTFDAKAFYESAQEAPLEAREQFVKIAILWIKRLHYGESKGLVDLRNRYSTETGAKIYQLLKKEIEELTEGQMLVFSHTECDNEELYDKTPIPYESLFVWRMGNAHRTLQQTFSSVVFKTLQELDGFVKNEKLIRISKTINREMDEYFYNTPFI